MPDPSIFTNLGILKLQPSQNGLFFYFFITKHSLDWGTGTIVLTLHYAIPYHVLGHFVTFPGFTQSFKIPYQVSGFHATFPDPILRFRAPRYIW